MKSASRTRKSKKPVRKKAKGSGFSAQRVLIFVFGLACGVALQFVPEIQAVVQKSGISLPATNQYNHSDGLGELFPSANPILRREGYVLAYDGRAKTALWVQEELTKETVSGSVQRSQFHFVPDADIPRVIQSDTADYRGSGFDRGHLAPAADHRSSSNAMRETFYLSNVSPQVPQFNRG